ncbi:MAG: hypothetical protein JXB88_05200 [Spirochaetales bacterium]|nr:hypothetical protein [Spirochaetales bacterium]
MTTINTIKKSVIKIIPFSLYRILRTIKRMLLLFYLLLIKRFVVNRKWKLDRVKTNRLEESHKKLYFSIQSFYYRRFKKFADIINPVDYNEKIQWLKLFDQDALMISCTDKYAVREYVKKTIGEKHLKTLYGVYERFKDIDFNTLPRSFVIKTNHDSGTIFLVKDKAKANWKYIKNRIKNSMSYVYGVNNGEWQYSFIPSKILVEQYLQPESDTLPVDYKFHCIQGEMQWLQYIFNRGENTTSEIYFDKNFNRMPSHLGRSFLLSDKPVQLPDNLNDMILIVEKLAAPFRYVRVDLFNINGAIFFGELTFFPRGGFYPSKDVVEFGKLMNFDMMNVKKPVTGPCPGN